MAIFNKYGHALNNNKLRNAIMTGIANKKKMFGQYGSIYEYPQAGRFHPRMYVNQDTEVGTNFLVRDLLMRWSREMYAQAPFIHSGIKALGMFSVGTEYKPDYIGIHEKLGKEYTDWLKQIFYPNACQRGRNYDFQTMAYDMSLALDVDGDFLIVFGEDENTKMPKVQIVPAHRIFSTTAQFSQDIVTPTMFGMDTPKEGPYPNTVQSDGVIYSKQGTPVAYNVVNSSNLVNSMLGNVDQMIFSIEEAHLQFDPIYFDRGRGLPSISSGILQALSLQEIQNYIVEKIKIQSMIAVEEKTPEGLGPYEEDLAYQNLLANAGVSGQVQQQEGSLNNLNILGGLFGLAYPQSSDKGLRVVTDPAIRYVSTEGSIKPLSTDASSEETNKYITKLESQVLQCIGIPEAILFSQGDVSGRMSDGTIKLFNAAVQHRQQVLDKETSFICSWAVARAIQMGELPPDDDENLGMIFKMTHPPVFNLNESYERRDDLEYKKNGLKSIQDIAVKYGKTADQIIEQKTEENGKILQSASKLAEKYNVDIKTVLQMYDENLKSTSAPFGKSNPEEADGNIGKKENANSKTQ